jgi:hypothetical protein
LLQPGDIYHANPQLVRAFLSSDSHKKYDSLNAYRRAHQMEFREVFLRKNGKRLHNVLPVRPPLSHLYEYNPYTPVHQQGMSPIFQFLDKQAQREEKKYQREHKFIPKPFMAPQIYLPAYLEVSYRSCTGCFVRLPQIKKDGMMEIPSPFPPDVHMRAAMFYTRYGRGVIRRQRGYRGYRLYWSKQRT